MHHMTMHHVQISCPSIVFASQGMLKRLAGASIHTSRACSREHGGGGGRGGIGVPSSATCSGSNILYECVLICAYLKCSRTSSATCRGSKVIGQCQYIYWSMYYDDMFTHLIGRVQRFEGRAPGRRRRLARGSV